MAALHDRLPPGHFIDQDFLDTEVIHVWVAMCSCGWRGQDARTERDAEEDLSIHHKATKEAKSA